MPVLRRIRDAEVFGAACSSEVLHGLTIYKGVVRVWLHKAA
jgi:hypothetical protein